MKKSFIFFFFYSIAICISGQKTGISGNVIDDNQQPVPFVSVVLLKNDSTKEQKAELTDLKGSFIFENIKPAKYNIILSSIGYKTKKINIEYPVPDSVETIYVLTASVDSLKEVVVTGKKIQRYADKNVYLIPSQVRKTSTTAFETLRILPKITVDVVNKTITTAKGEEVKILINGINSDIVELQALKTSDIIRIEHYEIPGARYASDGVGSVINVITRQGIEGGVMFTDLQNAPAIGFGDDLVSLKYNRYNSQINFNYSLSYRDYKKRTVDNNFEYQTPTGSIEKNKIGIYSPFGYIYHNFGLNYENQKENNYVFSLKFKTSLLDKHAITDQNIYYNNVFNGYTSDKNNKYSTLNPSIDLYFFKKITQNQEVIFDVVSTYYNLQNTDKYSELLNIDTLFYNSEKTTVSKYSNIAEAIYSLKINKNILNTGIKYDLANSSNAFLSTTGNEKIFSTLSDIYGYLEFLGNADKITYRINTGITYNSFSSKELAKKYNFITFRPGFDIDYTVNQNSDLKLTGSIEPYTPALSELSSSYIYYDSLFYIVGNPALKPYLNYKTDLTYSYNLSKINISSTLSYNYANSKILSEYNRMDSIYIETLANQKWEKFTSWDLYMQISPFENKLIEMELYGEIYQTKNKGSHFANSRFDKFYQVTISFNYKKMLFTYSCQNGFNVLNGEELKENPASSSAQLQFKNNNLTLGIGVYYPFEKSWNSTILSYNSPVLKTSYHVNIYDNGHMAFFRLAYNFSFGRKYKGATKKLENKDTDAGITKGKE